MSSNRHPLLSLFASLGVLCGHSSAPAAAAPAALPPDHAARMTRGLELFRTDIAPLLREHCVKCHGGEKTRNDFDLTTREGLLRGGAEGSAVTPFNASASRLLKLVRHELKPGMPEKQPQLPAAAIAKLIAWIDLGAPYDAPLIAGKTPARDRAVVSATDRQWWAFQPLSKVTPPAGAAHPVDAFLLAAAKPKGLVFNPPADPRTLLRRAFLGLTGLPPTPKDVAAFVAQQPGSSAPSQKAFAVVIDQLLDSPAYGERWARHWLDVARFAESSGFEHDYDRPHAFHYRDFVIKALNADMPFDQFARWQLAGDEFAPGDSLAMTATGFLGAGVFPTQITANEVERTRYDAMDDMLSTTASAFLGLTVGCARCHDHKFDPIPTQDYYRLLTTFTTTVRSNVELDLDQEKNRAQKTAWQTQRTELAAALQTAEDALRPAFATWLTSAKAEPETNAWTLLVPDSLKANNATETFKPLGDGSYLVEGTAPANSIHTITAPAALRRITAVRLETLAHPSMKSGGPGRASNGNFALAKFVLRVRPASGAARVIPLARAFADYEQNKNSLSIASSLDDSPTTGWAVDLGGIGKDHAAVFVLAQPLALAPEEKLVLEMQFTVNKQHIIGRPRFSVTDAAEPALPGGAVAADLAAALQVLRAGGKPSEAQSKTLFEHWKKRQPAWQTAQAKLTEHAAKEPRNASQVMICAEGHTPIVMHSQGPPFLKETHILKRGDTNQKQAPATQGFLQVLMRDADEQRWQWSPPPGAKYSGRRRSLANWLTDVEHGAGALMARVAVNRVWQHHFGRGLVPTPNDFGKTGVAPANPALLDWLAGEFIRSGWKLKTLHRLVLTSAAYQQSSAHDSAKAAADPDNALFLRHVPQRLESEAVRDSILAVSGVLDPAMFGAGTLNEASTRRSIYFTVKRSRLVNSMVVFDAPEPLTSQGLRPTTIVAPQALLLMNSPQARQWATAFARRVETEAATDDLTKLIAHSYTLALARPPQPAELQAATAFITSGLEAGAPSGKSSARTQALADFCQTLLALNEFVYVN